MVQEVRRLGLHGLCCIWKIEEFLELHPCTEDLKRPPFVEELKPKEIQRLFNTCDHESRFYYFVSACPFDVQVEHDTVLSV